MLFLCAGISAKHIDMSAFSGTRDFQFAKWLSTTQKLQGIPPSAFYGKEHKGLAQDYIRFCFFKVSCHCRVGKSNENKCLY